MSEWELKGKFIVSRSGHSLASTEYLKKYERLIKKNNFLYTFYKYALSTNILVYMPPFE